MPTEMSKEDIITTQEGTDLVVKPLTIRSLRKFMDVIEELNEHQREQEKAQAEYQKELRAYEEAEDTKDTEPPEPPKENEFAVIEIMIKAAQIALEKHNPDFAKDTDRLEDELDINILNQILETSGGIKMGDPNLSAAPGTTTPRA